MRPAARGLALLVGAMLLTMACAPGTSQGPRQDGASSVPAAPKILRVGVTFDDEPTEFAVAFGSIGAGATETRYLLNAPLTIYDDKGVLSPRTAQSVPTIENGGWTVSSDGRMETTWKLRPDVRWHDGNPFTAEDLMFGYRVATDPEWALGTRVLRSIDEMTAPDPYTLVVRWKNIEIFANQMGLNVLPPLARHLMAEPYATLDKQAFAANPYWSDQFIGLGPYRIQQWLRGSFMEIVANDDYFLGRPKIDRILFNYYGDTRGLLVATMAGEVDVIPVGYLKAEEAAVLKTQWEAPGNGSLIVNMVKLRNGWFQWRDPSAPLAQDARIRQALVRLLDRQNLVDTLHNGLSAVDDIFLPRDHPAYQLAKQKGLPDLSYDTNQAHRLLGEAGLNRGPEGGYRTSDGTPLAFEVSTSGDINTNVQEMTALISAWQTAGLQPTQVLITTNSGTREAEAKTRGVRLTSEALDYIAFDGSVTSEIAAESTRWRGRNSGAYTNPAFDRLYRDLYNAVDLGQQHQLAADMVKFQLDNMLYLPLVYSPSVSANRPVVRGLTSILPYQRLNAWNVHTWEMS
jgi:peptide/nickel transport system substrate-binding protein